MKSKNSHTIWCKAHLSSPKLKVYQMLATDEGRSRFWAESAIETDGAINFEFPNGQNWNGKVIEKNPPHRFAVEYLGKSLTTFELADDGRGGTILTLTDEKVSAEQGVETKAGWVSVLLALKAAADFGIDLRNHDSQRTWDEGFVDN